MAVVVRPEGLPHGGSGCVHPGPWTSLAVEGLPEALRTAELDTCWSERPEFGGRRPSEAFVRLLDQTALGSRGNHMESPAIPGDLVFPPPFSIEALPYMALARLSTAFPEALALEILRDWALILRNALSGLPRPRRGGEERLLLCSHCYYTRSELAAGYERAVLRWLVQRFAFERLRA
jgi:hypothetical protein